MSSFFAKINEKGKFKPIVRSKKSSRVLGGHIEKEPVGARSRIRKSSLAAPSEGLRSSRFFQSRSILDSKVNKIFDEDDDYDDTAVHGTESKEFNDMLDQTLATDPRISQQDDDTNEPSIEKLKEIGQRRGYPSLLDKEKLAERTRLLIPEIRELMKHTLGSDEQWTEDCEISKNIIKFATHFSGPVIDVPALLNCQKLYMFGYYGTEGGQDVVATALKDKLGPEVRPLLRNTQKQWLKKFLDMETVVRAILAPELVVRLVMDDQDVGYREALDILKESEDYGRHVIDASFKADLQLNEEEQDP